MIKSYKLVAAEITNMKSFKGPKTQNEVHNDDKLMWESFVSREADDSTDHHNDYMMDQDLLQPLHAAAIKTGAKDINDWMIKQIKDQGENWTNWFIDTVIGDEEDYEDHPVDEASNDDDVKDLQSLHDNPDEEFAKKNYGSVQAYKDMLKKKIDKLLDEGSNEDRALGDDEIQARVAAVVQKYLSLDDKHPMSGDPQYVSDVLSYVRSVVDGNGDPQNQYEGWTKADLVKFDKDLRYKMEEYLNPDDLMYM